MNVEEIGSCHRADRDHALHVAVVKLVPRIAVQSGQAGIRHDRAYAQRLAGKIHTERAPHEAAPTVRPDKIAGANRFLAIWPRKACRNAVFVLLEPGQLTPDLAIVARSEARRDGKEG